MIKIKTPINKYINKLMPANFFVCQSVVILITSYEKYLRLQKNEIFKSFPKNLLISKICRNFMKIKSLFAFKKEVSLLIVLKHI
jgi:hypothetical protein